MRNPLPLARPASAAPHQRLKPAEPDAGPPLARPHRALLLVLSATMLIDALEVSVVVVALPSIAGPSIAGPSIGGGLRMPLSAAQWLMSGFALGFGGMLLFGGRVVDQLGQRRVYLVALLCYAALCVVSGLAPNAGALIVSRVGRGCCAALTAPTGLAIIARTFPEGAARNRALAVYAAFGASGFTAGLLLSGLLTEISWRWTLMFPAPVALAIAAVAWRAIPRAHPGPGKRYDAGGALTLAGGAALLVYAIATAPEHDWPVTAAAAAIAAALLAGFVLIERGVRDPLLPLRLLSHGTLTRAGLAAAALNGSYWGLLLIATFRLQDGLGWRPLPTALAFLPASVPPMLAAPFSRHLVRWLGARRLVIAGLLVATAGNVVALANPPKTYLTGFLPVLLLVGVGYVGAFSALHVHALSGVPADAARTATGVYQSLVQIGGALVLAVVTALSASYRPVFAAITAVSALGVAAAVAAVAGRNDHAEEPAGGARYKNPGTR